MFSIIILLYEPNNHAVLTVLGQLLTDLQT